MFWEDEEAGKWLGKVFDVNNQVMGWMVDQVFPGIGAGVHAEWNELWKTLEGKMQKKKRESERR